MSVTSNKWTVVPIYPDHFLCDKSMDFNKWLISPLFISIIVTWSKHFCVVVAVAIEVPSDAFYYIDCMTIISKLLADRQYFRSHNSSNHQFLTTVYSVVLKSRVITVSHHQIQRNIARWKVIIINYTNVIATVRGARKSPWNLNRKLTIETLHATSQSFNTISLWIFV